MAAAVALLELIAVLLAGGLIYLWPDLAPWPLLAAPVFWLVSLVGKVFGKWPVHLVGGLSGWVVLFLASAGLGLWASYDPGLGLTVFGPGGLYKFWLIVAAALVYFAVARLPGQRAVWLVSAAFGLFGALVGLYFMLTHNFGGETVKFAFVNRLGLFVQDMRPQVPVFTEGRSLHPNVAGGLVAMFIPALIQAVMEGWRWQKSAWLRVLVLAGSLGGLLIAALGLLLSSSRGAWLASGVALGGWLAWAVLRQVLRQRGMGSGASLPLRAGLLAGTALAGLLAVLAMLPNLLGLFPPFLGGESTLISRLDLMDDALWLVQAAPFTGTGLGTFPMMFSTYVLLIDIPFISHAHNVLLNILISQGWPGLLIYLGLVLMALWLAFLAARRAEGKWPLASSVAMLAISLVHGLVDDPLYGSRALLVWLVPVGLIAAIAQNEGLRLPNPFRKQIGLFGALVAALVVVGLINRHTLAAAYERNLGVVRQARTELSIYNPNRFQQQTLDQVRQAVDLAEAERHFQRALALQAGDPVAGQHLAAVSLSRWQYEQGLAITSRLWSAGHRDRVTRLLHGSALAANGQPQTAAEVIAGIAWAESRMNAEAWYRYYQTGDYARAADAYRVVLFINPNNASAKYGLSEAEKRVNIGTIKP